MLVSLVEESFLMIFRSWSHIDHVGGTKKQKYIYMINAKKNFYAIVCVLDDKITSNY